MKLWKDKDWIWIQNDDGSVLPVHVDYVPWLMHVLPEMVENRMERTEFELPPLEDMDKKKLKEKYGAKYNYWQLWMPCYLSCYTFRRKSRYSKCQTKNRWRVC